jgi:hypothetical protein
MFIQEARPKIVVFLNATFLEEIKDRQCAEINRQKIECESPLSGKA